MSVTDFGDQHQIIHIPARDLAGTRDAKLAELDLLLAQLQVVRLALCGQVVHLQGLDGTADERRRDARVPGNRLAAFVRAVRRAFSSRATEDVKDRRS